MRLGLSAPASQDRVAVEAETEAGSDPDAITKWSYLPQSVGAPSRYCLRLTPSAYLCPPVTFSSVLPPRQWQRKSPPYSATLELQGTCAPEEVSTRKGRYAWKTRQKHWLNAREGQWTRQLICGLRAGVSGSRSNGRRTDPLLFCHPGCLLLTASPLRRPGDLRWLLLPANSSVVQVPPR